MVDPLTNSPVIRLNRPGNTILQLRETGEKKRPLASDRLIFSPINAGAGCSSFFLGTNVFMTDCSRRCVAVSETNCDVSRLPQCVPISERIGDGMCNYGRLLDNGRRDINLACSNFAFDGGDCVVRENPSLNIKDCSE